MELEVQQKLENGINHKDGSFAYVWSSCCKCIEFVRFQLPLSAPCLCTKKLEEETASLV
uniref:Uncharacterized protein n=1 Tax=Arundo donax TaxID=35708 RepID=A0A0A8ZAS8_ARUDO